jgi:hypothetical protein
MFRALTGRGQNDNPLTEAERTTYWATTFRALGDVVHLIQDTAQPQHTRNEAHPGSVYEKYIENLAQARPQAPIYRLGSPTLLPSLDLTALPPYPAPSISKYLDVFTTDPFAMSPSTGRGLADYSNRGFFTARNNFGAPNNYVRPDPVNASLYTREQIPGGVLAPALALSFLRGSVFDAQTNSSNEIRMTAEGLFVAYTMTREVFDDQARLLLPRAIGYSSAMLDYFFRGRLDYVFSGGTSTIQVKNLSTEAMNGHFGLYYDGIDGKRYPAVADPTDPHRDPNDIYGWTLNLPAKPSDPNSTVNVSDVLSFIPPSANGSGVPPKSPDTYILVFNGDMGSELHQNSSDNAYPGALAAKVVKPDVTNFLVTPDYTPSDGLGGTRLIGLNGGAWQATNAAGQAAGNVDWKGAFINDKPSKTLSWMGAKSRHFFDTLRDHYGANIYQGGALWTVAPGPVHGAAIAVDGSGKEWIVAIAESADNLSVFTRPNKKSPDPSLFDATNKPEGWRMIGSTSLSALNLGATSPWFFNGTGLEARAVLSGLKGKFSLTMSDISSAQATFSTESNTPVPGAETTTDLSQPRHSTMSVNTVEDCLSQGGTQYTQGQTWETDTDVTIVDDDSTTGIIAVDFNNLTELVATGASSRLQKSQSKGIEDSPAQAYNFPRPSCQGTVTNADSITSQTTFNASSSDQWTSSLLIGGTRIDMPANSAVGTTVVVDNYSGVNGIGNGLVSTSCGEVVTTTATTQVPLFIYLDLRDSTAAIYRHSVKQVEQAVVSACAQNGVVTTTSSDEEAIDIYTNGTKTTSVIASRTGPNDCNGTCNASDVGNFGIGFGLSGSGQRVYSIQAQSIVIDPSQVKRINFISGGSLETVLPTAPSNATYFPVGVLK